MKEWRILYGEIRRIDVIRKYVGLRAMISAKVGYALLIGSV
jgi:hypothetical protein